MDGRIAFRHHAGVHRDQANRLFFLDFANQYFDGRRETIRFE